MILLWATSCCQVSESKLTVFVCTVFDPIPEPQSNPEDTNLRGLSMAPDKVMPNNPPKIRRLSSEAFRPFGPRSTNTSADPDTASQEGEICTVCEAEVKGDDMGVECCTCLLWFHSKCQGISKAAYNALAKHKMFSWHCAKCRPGLGRRGVSDSDGETRMEKLESKMDALICLVRTALDNMQEENKQVCDAMRRETKQLQDSMGNNMEKVEKVMRAHAKLVGDQEEMLQKSFRKMHDEKASYAEAVKGNLESIQNVMKKMEESPPQAKEKTSLNTEKAIAGVFDNYLDQEKRKLNVVLHNIPEPSSNVYAERVESDKAKFIEVIRDSMHLNVKATKAYRVGKPDQEKPRLLIVGLENIEVKSEILKMAPQLRATEKWSNVYISPDLTWKEREEGRRLREELKRRTSAGEANLIIRRGRITSRGPQAPNQHAQGQGQPQVHKVAQQNTHRDTDTQMRQSPSHPHGQQDTPGRQNPY